jgi:chemotaxis family two-component system response regulator Rcp1
VLLERGTSSPSGLLSYEVNVGVLPAAPLATAHWLLPDQTVPEPEPPPFPAETVEKSSKPRVVALLAEDNRADVLIIEEAIALYGLPIDLHVVDDGEKAFALIQRTEVDAEAPCPQILLLDLNLPKRTGKEVLHLVRQSQRCKDIPVLVITSSDSPKDRKEVAELGANYYFRKPSSYDEFLKVGEVLKKLLERI